MTTNVLAKAPLGHAGDDPKQSEGANGDKRACCTDESRQPICYSQPNAPALSNGSARVVNKQRQPVERTDDASQNLGCLIGKQPQRRRMRRQGDQPLHCSLANPAQTERIGCPTCRSALHRNPPQFPWQGLQQVTSHEPDVDQIPQVNPILIAIRYQFHAH